MRRMMGNIAREAGPAMGKAFQAVRNSPLAREFGQVAMNEFKMKSFGTDTTFTNGVIETITNLPETIAKHASNTETTLVEKVAGVTRDAIAKTFGETSKGKIVAGLGQIISNAIDETASKTANGANKLSSGFTNMNESLARATMETMNKEPAGRPRLGGGHQ